MKQKLFRPPEDIPLEEYPQSQVSLIERLEKCVFTDIDYASFD